MFFLLIFIFFFYSFLYFINFFFFYFKFLSDSDCFKNFICYAFCVIKKIYIIFIRWKFEKTFLKVISKINTTKTNCLLQLMNPNPAIIRFPSSTLSFTKKLLPSPSIHSQTPPNHAHPPLTSLPPPVNSFSSDSVVPSTISYPKTPNPPVLTSPSNPPPSLLPPSSSYRSSSPSSVEKLLVEKLNRRVELLEKENSDLVLLNSNQKESSHDKFMESDKERRVLIENIDELKKKIELERQKSVETSNYLKKSVRDLEEENHKLRKIIEENKKELNLSLSTSKEIELRKELEKLERFISENRLENPFFREFISKLDEIGKQSRNSVCNTNRDAFYKSTGSFFGGKENTLKIEGEKNSLDRLRKKMNYSSSKNKNKGLEDYQTSLKMRGREMSMELQRAKLIS